LNKLHVAAGLPTLLIWGDDDRIIPVAHAYAAHDAVMGSRLEVLKGVGHFPHAEAPTAVADILENFIATTTPQQRSDSPTQAGYVADAYRGDRVRRIRP
jgi:alpha-beta hydrolase superfamily lysophospholipase